MSGCSNDVIEYQDSQREEYIKNFIQEFGIPAPGHTYNVSQKVSVTLDVADPKISSVRIFTAFPGNKDCRLIARKTVATREFYIDIFNSQDYVFAEFLDGNDNVISGKYVNISGDRLTIKDERAASRAMSLATRGENQSSKITGGTTLYNGNKLGWEGTVKDKLLADVRILTSEDDYSEPSSDQFTFGDMWNLVGKGAIFEESAYIDGKCILTRYGDAFKVKEGVSFTTTGATDIVVNYIYGKTVKTDAFGYFYYPEGSSEEVIAKATKYVLIGDATPGNYIYYDGNNSVDQTVGSLMTGDFDDPKNWAVTQLNSKCNKPVTTRKFRLTYFDDKGVAQDKFPAGYTIAFFGTLGKPATEMSNWDSGVKFSLPWMADLQPLVHETCGSTNGCDYTGKHPAYNFISYMWGERVIMGFEDEGGDDDFNDIMFYIEGDFDKSKLTRITDDGNHLKPQGCLLAVEDLGSTDDWDFNDLVVGVAVEDKDDNTKVVTVDPLAAGGTLPIHLMYTDKDGKNYFVGPEFHSWFDVSTSTIYNTGVQAVQPSTFVKFTVPSSFSMSPDTESGSNMGGFWVLVDAEGKYADYYTYELMEAPADLEGNTINPPTSVDKGESTVPYMLCLGEDWHWPRERKNINAAYDGGFASWVSEPSVNWYASGHTNYVIMDLITLKPGERPTSVIVPTK